MTAFSELISRLQQVPQEERSRVTLSMLLETVGSEFASVIWGAAVVHWFTPEILMALRPELADRVEGFYQRLQGFQFVRETDEGPRLHEGTRELLLTRLAADHPQDFQLLSGRAAEYFGQFKDSVSLSLTIYHRLVADPERARRELFALGSRWLAASRQTEIMGMLQFLDEHVSSGRISDGAQGDILIWKGKAEIKFINTIGILNQRSIFDARDYFDQALSLYESDHDHWGMAQAWQGRGDVLLFLDQWKEARAAYEQALDRHQGLDDPRGKMETLKGLGDVLRFLGHFDQAWDCYRQAIVLSEPMEDHQIRSDLYRLIQTVAQPEKTEDANRSVELLSGKDLEDARPYLDRFHQLCDEQDYESAFDLLTLQQSSNEAAYPLDFFLQLRGFNEIRQILWERLLNEWIFTETEHQHKQGYIREKIGDVLQFQDRREEALSRYQEALSLYESTGARLGKANALTGIGSLQSDPKQALTYFQSAQELYIQIGDRYNQGRNLYQFISPAQAQLGDQAAADQSREQALSIARELGIRTE